MFFFTEFCQGTYGEFHYSVVKIIHGRNKRHPESQTAGETVVPNTGHGLQDRTKAQIIKVRLQFNALVIAVDFSVQSNTLSYQQVRFDSHKPTFLESYSWYGNLRKNCGVQNKQFQLTFQTFVPLQSHFPYQFCCYSRGSPKRKAFLGKFLQENALES